MVDGSDEYEVHANGYHNGHANGNGYADDMDGFDDGGMYVDAQEEA